MGKTYKGALRISRVHSNMEDDFIEITIVDEESESYVVRTKSSVLDFANAVLGNFETPCQFESYSALLGKKRENKTEIVCVPKCEYSKQDKEALKAMKKFEVDGWKGREDDLKNHHNKVHCTDGSSNIKVVFIRYVDSN